MDEGWGKNLAAGALMTAATLGGMSNADAGNRDHNRNKPQTQMVQPTKLDSMINVKGDSTSFKSYGVGESSDLATAKKIAVSNAKSKMAQELGGGTQTIMNISIENELAKRTPNGFIYHVVIAMPKYNIQEDWYDDPRYDQEEPEPDEYSDWIVRKNGNGIDLILRSENGGEYYFDWENVWEDDTDFDNVYNNLENAKNIPELNQKIDAAVNEFINRTNPYDIKWKYRGGDYDGDGGDSYYNSSDKDNEWMDYIN